jgi:hypothetical protein
VIKARSEYQLGLGATLALTLAIMSLIWAFSSHQAVVTLLVFVVSIVWGLSDNNERDIDRGLQGLIPITCIIYIGTACVEFLQTGQWGTITVWDISVSLNKHLAPWYDKFPARVQWWLPFSEADLKRAAANQPRWLLTYDAAAYGLVGILCYSLYWWAVEVLKSSSGVFRKILPMHIIFRAYAYQIAGVTLILLVLFVMSVLAAASNNAVYLVIFAIVTTAWIFLAKRLFSERIVVRITDEIVPTETLIPSEQFQTQEHGDLEKDIREIALRTATIAAERPAATPRNSSRLQGRGFRMIWADRIGIGVFALVFLGMTIMWGSWYRAGEDPPVLEVALKIVEAASYVAVPAWLVLRIVDFMAGGPMRRRRARLKAEA